MRSWCLFITTFLLVCASTEPIFANTEQAEIQLKVARRLSASDRIEARKAFDRVVALDPEGPFVGDALVESVLLDRPPTMPLDLGRINEKLRERWLRRLERVPEDSSRYVEAKRLRAMLHLAPILGRDAKLARRLLLELTTRPSDDQQSALARAWLAWLDAIEGRPQAAANAWTRVIAEGRSDQATNIAIRQLELWSLRDNKAREALEWNRRANHSSTLQDSLKQLAWRHWQSIDGQPQNFSKQKSSPIFNGVRGEIKLVADTKRICIARIKDEQVECVGLGKNDASENWSLSNLTALTLDPFGRLLAATDDEIVQLVKGGHESLVPLVSFKSPRSISADVTGTVWLIDRRGSKLGTIDVKGKETVVYSERSARWIEVRMAPAGPVFVDGRSGRLQQVDAEGVALKSSDTSGRAHDLAVDLAGWIYLLDAKEGRVDIRSSDFALRQTLQLETLGVAKPEHLGITPSGELLIYDEATEEVRMYP